MTEITEPTAKRGPGRPPMRPDTARKPLRDRLRGRTRKYEVTTDRFYIDPATIPDGVSMEWKRWSVQGQEDPFYLANLRGQGWEPVDAEDMPDLVPDGFTGPIIKDGLCLMARPMELTIEARQEIERVSKRQVGEREKMLGLSPSGHAERTKPVIDKQVFRPVPVEE